MKNRIIVSLLSVVVVSIVAFSQAYALNLVVNGSFESGNINFLSQYTYQANLQPAGVYYIGENPHDYHSAFAIMGAQDGQKMMIINGANSPNVTVWGENGIAVLPDTTYYFSTWVSSVHSESPANLSFSVNGSFLGGLTASSTVGVWNQFYATWNSGSSTLANLALVNLNTAFAGNDFALDNIILDTTNPIITSTVPEPSTMLLLGFGMIGLAGAARKKMVK